MQHQARRRVLPRRPGQILPVLAGIFLAVLGMLVLTGSGLHWNHLSTSTGDTLSFRQSGLLGIAELGFGLALVWSAGGFLWAGRAVVAGLGAAAVLFGIALSGWSQALAGIFGGDAASGWLFIGVGAVTLFGGLVPARRTVAAGANTADLASPAAPAKRIRRVS